MTTDDSSHSVRHYYGTQVRPLPLFASIRGVEFLRSLHSLAAILGKLASVSVRKVASKDEDELLMDAGNNLYSRSFAVDIRIHSRF
jgi:hypothetical protein